MRINPKKNITAWGTIAGPGVFTPHNMIYWDSGYVGSYWGASFSVVNIDVKSKKKFKMAQIKAEWINLSEPKKTKMFKWPTRRNYVH